MSFSDIDNCFAADSTFCSWGHQFFPGQLPVCFPHQPQWIAVCSASTLDEQVSNFCRKGSIFWSNEPCTTLSTSAVILPTNLSASTCPRGVDEAPAILPWSPLDGQFSPGLSDFATTLSFLWVLGILTRLCVKELPILMYCSFLQKNNWNGYRVAGAPAESCYSAISVTWPPER